MDEEKNVNTEGGEKPDTLKEVISWIKVVLAAVAISLFINYVVIVNAAVPSGSMRETIPEPSRLVAFRLAYLFSSPQRFDVIVFRFPDNESVLHVKRIIGMPGEQVDIIDGQVFINGSAEPLDDSFLLETPNPGRNQQFFVPEGHFFMMGDNRNDSHDSRTWINSFLPEGNILGRAVFTYFPRLGLIR